METGEVTLDEKYPDRKVLVGSNTPDPVRPDLINFLKTKMSCFAWSHFDMTGIDAEVITHKLNIDKSYKPVQQKRRKLAAERYEIVIQEVDKLLDMGMIKEVMYTE